MGFCLLVGYFMASLVNRSETVSAKSANSYWIGGLTLIAKGVCFIALCSHMWLMAMKTVHRSYEWRTEAELSSSALSVCPSSLTVLTNCASLYINKDPYTAIPYLSESSSALLSKPSVVSLFFLTEHRCS
jgi:hypothetical protein